MNPVDEIELEVLDASGDVELAELSGQVAREAVCALARVVAEVLGVDPAELVADVEVLMGIA